MLTSWGAIAFGGFAAVAYMIYYIYVEYRPACMVRFFKNLKSGIRKALKKNKAFMNWLYEGDIVPDIAVECKVVRVRTYQSWKRADFK